MISRLLHVSYAVEGTWRLLKRHSWNWPQPTRRAIELDDDAVEVRKKAGTSSRSQDSRQERPISAGLRERWKPPRPPNNAKVLSPNAAPRPSSWEPGLLPATEHQSRPSGHIWGT
ncbi:winged helix-turn-helix domain-containing protein [Kitasatospora sp. RB6PN24]|nr:winged helix-turn-helix domain-containing protein [Kitasatospora humi]MCC9311610.1 winged helix-turn-helix domain-containing protein [Kitasatospora humi]